MYVIRSDLVLPKIYQWSDVILTKHVIVERFSDSFVIRWKGKWILQKGETRYERPSGNINKHVRANCEGNQDIRWNLYIQQNTIKQSRHIWKHDIMCIRISILQDLVKQKHLQDMRPQPSDNSTLKILPKIKLSSFYSILVIVIQLLQAGSNICRQISLLHFLSDVWNQLCMSQAWETEFISFFA